MMSEVKTVDELKELARGVLTLPKSAFRDQIVDFARTARQREDAFQKAGNYAVKMSRTFGDAMLIAKGAAWLVYLRKKYGLDVFEEVIKDY